MWNHFLSRPESLGTQLYSVSTCFIGIQCVNAWLPAIKQSEKMTLGFP